ncbi:hypothetical protein BC828DRAFT_408114 [Blastocladiella britannica]|nr:hypothetical protein BC828DRAFT_408114 [Blastocladiella britannica]
MSDNASTVTARTAIGSATAKTGVAAAALMALPRPPGAGSPVSPSTLSSTSIPQSRKYEHQPTPVALASGGMVGLPMWRAFEPPRLVNGGTNASTAAVASSAPVPVSQASPPLPFPAPIAPSSSAASSSSQ